MILPIILFNAGRKVFCESIVPACCLIFPRLCRTFPLQSLSCANKCTYLLICGESHGKEGLRQEGALARPKCPTQDLSLARPTALRIATFRRERLKEDQSYESVAPTLAIHSIDMPLNLLFALFFDQNTKQRSSSSSNCLFSIRFHRRPGSISLVNGATPSQLLKWGKWGSLYSLGKPSTVLQASFR